MAWVYNQSRGSLLLMVLFHFSLTGSFFVFGPPLSVSDTDWLQFDLVSLAVPWCTILVVLAIGAAAAQSGATGKRAFPLRGCLWAATA